mmetsp:Transcript_6065/g.20219  ORF Transcript_6065/g.20219 Transcript_6065/m.20219 type:complete len:205 (-) Transcript_6065:963-1577(-)
MSSPASFSSREKKAPRESEPLFSFLPYLPTSANVTKPAASSAFALKLRSPSSSTLALAKRNVETARASSFSVVSANDLRVSGANESATVLANALPLPFLGVNSSSLSLVSVNTPAASAAAAIQILTALASHRVAAAACVGSPSLLRSASPAESLSESVSRTELESSSSRMKQGVASISFIRNAFASSNSATATCGVCGPNASAT